MSGGDENITLEDQIYEVSELIENYINDFVEREVDIDSINNGLIDFAKFKNNDIIDAIKLEESKELILELSLSRVISNFLSLKTSENDQNLKQIATLIDFGFYLKQNGDGQYDLPLVLTIIIFREAPVDWLLKFWSYFDLRVENIKSTKDDQVLQGTRYPGSSVIMSLNLRINQFENNNEPAREVLKSKMLTFTSRIFPFADRFLINKKFDINSERTNEIRYKRAVRNSNFNAFWRLQTVFNAPLSAFEIPRKIDDVFSDMDSVLRLISDIESKQRPHTSSYHKRGFKEPSADNSFENYTRLNLSNAKKEELKEFYSNKEFSPSFLINEQKFNEQIRQDENLKKVILLQMYILCSFLISLVSDTDVMTNPKFAVHKFRRFAKAVQPRISTLLQFKKELQFLFQSIEKRIFFTNQQITISEFTFLKLKLDNFKDYEKIYEEFKADDEILGKLKKLGEFKNRFWAQYGTPQITKHWKIPTGLELLEKDAYNGTPDQIDEEIKALRNSIENTDDENVKNLNSWKALRLARKNHLFKFKHVNEATGPEGLFDPSLKVEYDKKKQEEDAKREKEEEEKKQEELKKQEEERLELERKRKASEEEFAVQSKRAKLESANGTKDSEDLDY